MTTMDPRFVGIAAMIAGGGYVIASSISLFLPAFAQWGQLAMVLGTGELAIFWLLIWGAKPQPGATAHPTPATA